MESLGDVDGDIVDAILHGALAEGGEHLRHLTAVVGGDLLGLQPQFLSTLEVDEEVRPGIIVEVHLVGHIIGMEDNDLVLVMTKVAKGVEELFKVRGFNRVSRFTFHL